MAVRSLKVYPDDTGGASNHQGTFNPQIGAPNAGAIGGRKRGLPTNTYRWDPSGKLEVAVPEEQLPDPNGICFSPDYKTLYVISTGKGPGDTGPGGDRNIYAFDVQGTKVANKRLFTACGSSLVSTTNSLNRGEFAKSTLPYLANWLAA